MAYTSDIGFAKEKEAAKLLQKRGYKILETNFSTKFGEIDIIAKHKDIIVFVEVKYRKNLSAGMPYEAVNKSKQNKIIKSALLYVKQKGLKNDFRFDIISITDDEIEIMEAAFSSDRYFI